MKQDALSREELASLLERETPLPTSESHPADLDHLPPEWHLRLGKCVAGQMTTLVRCEVHLEPTEFRSCTDHDMIREADSPTCLATIHRTPTEPPALLEINLPALQPTFDRMLGGNEPSAIERRPLTEIERRLASRVIQLWIDSFDAIWPADHEWVLTLTDIESQPQIQTGAKAETVMLLAQYPFSMRAARGTVRLAIPECWLAELKQDEPLSAEDATDAFIELTVELDPQEIDATDITRLETGDILSTTHAISRPLCVTASDGRQAMAVVGSRDGKKAIRIVDGSP